MIRRTLLLLAGVQAAVLAAPPLSAAALEAQEIEEILDFDVSIEVRDGGVMHVREEIRVRALGRQIRRGIFRDIPTSFPRWLNLGRIEAPFEVLSVTRNGRPEPYTLEAVGGPLGRRGMRVRIGSPNVLLAEAVHDYAIEYETSRWVRFGEGTDELYWNVTGNDWDFPIRSATARVRVAGVEEEPRLEAWTGPEGSTATDAEIRWDAGSATAVFETTDRLTPGEGLTIGVAFPSGRLAPPTEAQQSRWFRLDWGGWIESGYVVLLVVAVYLLMWRRVGMDPPPGRVGLAEEPPEGYSPAALGYIEERGYGQELLSAALVSMALKGAIRLEQYDDSWTLTKLAEPEELDEPLSPEEAALFGELLESRSSIALSRTNHRTLRSGIKAFRSSLKGRLEREYFENNRVWFGVGLAVSLIGFAALAWRWRFDINPVALFLGFWLTIWSAGVGSMAHRIVQQFGEARRGGGPAAWSGLGFFTLFFLPFLIAEIVVAAILFTMVPVHLLVAGILIGLTNVVFYHLLERPTLKGRGVLDGLAAFRAHLESTADAVDRGAAGAHRVAIFERFLPFAIALGLAERWTEAFGDVLSPALAAGVSPDGLSWYRPDLSDGRFEPARFASDLGSGLSGRMSAMSSPPSSSGSGSSGGFSGGGGSSGGGGGGGGGGGW